VSDPPSPNDAPEPGLDPDGEPAGTPRFLDTWVRFMLRHRAPVLVVTILLTGVFGVMAATLPVVTTLRDLLPDDRPEILGYDEARARFGGDETLILALVSDAHFTEAGLARLERLTERLGEHPLVERASSLANADQIHLDPEDPDTLLIEPYLRDGASPATIRAAALADPLMRGSYVSDDGQLLTVLVQLVGSTDDIAKDESVRAEILRRADQIPGGAERLDGVHGGRRALEFIKQIVGPELIEVAVEVGYDEAEVYGAGFNVVLGVLVNESVRHIQVLFPICLAMVGLALIVLLRRSVDVVLPLLCVVPATAWGVALGGLVFGRVSLVSSAAPIMVLVVGVSDVVHLVTQFRHELARGHGRDEAIRIAFDQVGTACALTSLTTFIGFGAMVFLPLPHSRELGVFAGLGVVCAFFLSFVLTPILLSFTHPEPGAVQRDADPLLSRILRRVAVAVAARPRAALAVGLLFTTVTLVGTSRITTENALLEKLPDGHGLRAAFRVIEDHIGSTGEFELLFDTGAPDGAKAPAFLRALAAVEASAASDPRADEAVSILDPLRRMHALMAPDLAAEDPIPDSRPLVAQYLLLLDMGENQDLGSILGPDRRHARMVVRVPDQSAESFAALAEEMERVARTHLPPGATVSANGIGLLLARAGPEITENSLKGLATALVLIAIVMGLRFRSVRVGAISMIPNLAPVAFGIWVVSLVIGQVDADTMVFMTVSIGIAVDDTIHFLARYRIEREQGRDRPTAVAAGIQEAGLGIARTSVILIAGFGVVSLSMYQGLRMMGFMLPATLLSAVVLDLTLLHLGWLDHDTEADGPTGGPAPPSAGVRTA
jgi:predicted RND superfamily exporter protein